MEKVKTIETPQERLELARRYLENAREMLKKAGIDRRRGAYIDLKYISEASGTAYLASLEALKALFMQIKNWDVEKVRRETKDISSYRKILKNLPIGKDRDLLQGFLNDVYDLLHLGGYYTELQDKKAIDSGFEKVEKIIKIVEKYVKSKSTE